MTEIASALWRSRSDPSSAAMDAADVDDEIRAVERAEAGDLVEPRRPCR